MTSLVEQAQLGNRIAFGELVKRFEPTVYAVALSRLRNPTEAQELTQEVFLHGMRKLDQLREPAAFPGWLKQITVRMALNRLTRRGPVQEVESEVLEAAEARGSTPVEDLIRNEQAAELYKGLEFLKTLDRETLVAFYLRSRTLKQMAREFETPVGTIKRRLHVARNRLKRVLETLAEGKVPPKPKKRPRQLACV